jgi:hypothetical protein
MFAKLVPSILMQSLNKPVVSFKGLHRLVICDNLGSKQLQFVHGETGQLLQTHNSAGTIHVVLPLADKPENKIIDFHMANLADYDRVT